MYELLQPTNFVHVAVLHIGYQRLRGSAWYASQYLSYCTQPLPVH